MFKDILVRILEQSHGIGVVLMGHDGIAVEQAMAAPENIDTHLVAVEYANVLKEIRKAAEVLQAGPIEEVAIHTDKLVVILRMLSDEYFIALTMGVGGNVGKARYFLMRDAATLRMELAG